MAPRKYQKLYNMSRKELHHLYIKRNKSMDDIADLVGNPCKELVSRRLKVLNIYKSKKLIDLCKKKTYQKTLGVDNPSKVKYIRRKAEKTCNKRFGSNNIFSSELFKNNMKKLNIERYGVPHNMMDSGVRKMRENTMLERYGVTHAAKSFNFRRKMKRQIKDHKDNMSSAEVEILELLITMYSKVTFQFYDKERYPFNCDFYIPCKDLFIEVNGYWTHGPRKLDRRYNDVKEFLKLIHKKKNKSEAYQGALDVYTKRDPLKRKTAKKNNLKYLELWSVDINNLSTTELKDKIRRFANG